MQRFRSIGFLLSCITGLLVVVLVAVFTYAANGAYTRRAHATHILALVDTTRDMFLGADGKPRWALQRQSKLHLVR